MTSNNFFSYYLFITHSFNFFCGNHRKTLHLTPGSWLNEVVILQSEVSIKGACTGNGCYLPRGDKPVERRGPADRRAYHLARQGRQTGPCGLPASSLPREPSRHPLAVHVHHSDGTIRWPTPTPDFELLPQLPESQSANLSMLGVWTLLTWGQPLLLANKSIEVEVVFIVKTLFWCLENKVRFSNMEFVAIMFKDLERKLSDGFRSVRFTFLPVLLTFFPICPTSSSFPSFSIIYLISFAFQFYFMFSSFICLPIPVSSFFI